jgi:superfamily II DNA or RNA helicase
MSLKQLFIPIALNTSKDSLIETFFVPCLQNSIKYDRGVGYFSSSWLRESFKGMNDFAKQKGKARWITSPILSKEDWDALLLGNIAKDDEIIKKSLIKVLLDLEKSLQKDTLTAFSWMVADGIIDFRLAKPRNKLSHEYHAKVGIFTDKDGNRLSFDGSYNDSVTGLHNFESLKVFRSWDESHFYVEQECVLFEKIWEGEDPNIEVFEIPEAARASILKLRENSERPYPNPQFNHGFSNNDFTEIKIPSPSIPENLILRNYQNDAINNWFANHNHGIFEMATGTGKTVTALSALTRLLDEKERLFTIIICPYIHLAQQWMSESEKFNFRPELVAESKHKWLENINKIARDFSAKRINQAVVITTNSSFLKEDLRSILGKYKILEETLIIADEMHHCGSKEMLAVLPKSIPFRLGLSATPIRDYDEIGSEKIIEYFGDIVFKFELKEAIEQNFLTRYFYHPIPVYLKDDEFDEFIYLTKRLNRLHPDPNMPISEGALLLAIRRARVLNNSKSKIEWIKENIISSSEIKHTLFYVGDAIFDDVLRVLGVDKELIVHEFTHRQNLKERQDLLHRFSDGIVQAFVAMKCLDEGVDIPPTRNAYFLASSSISREFVQRRGRILRNFPGKEEAIIFDLISIPPKEYLDRGKFGENYSAVRSAIKREYKRITEFASLAENRHQALGLFLDVANNFDLLDI